MKTQRYAITAFVTVLLLAGRFAAAQPQCDTIFDPRQGGEPVNEGDWFEPDNWDNGRPDATKVACIPPGKLAEVFDGDGEAKAIWIQADQNGVGSVEIAGSPEPARLTLYTDSTIDGELVARLNAELVISGQITIEGVGGGINMYKYVGQYGPAIVGTDANAKLTIQPGPGGSNSSLSTSFCIWGAGPIDVELDNRAIVVASDNAFDLIVNKPATGDGVWTSRHVNAATEWQKQGPGTLAINAEVTGSGQWRLTQTGQPHLPRIVVNTACTNLTGDVSVSNGFLEVNADFTTTGNLSMTGAGKIKVNNGAIARFDVN